MSSDLFFQTEVGMVSSLTKAANPDSCQEVIDFLLFEGFSAESIQVSRFHVCACVLPLWCRWQLRAFCRFISRGNV